MKTREKTPIPLATAYALITRPEPQAQELADAIRQSGGQTWVKPMLVIQPLAETQAMKDCLLSLDRYDRVIVTSRPAARLGLDRIDHYWPQLPINLMARKAWYAIGSSTATELQHYHIQATPPTSGVDSEALLELEELIHIEGERILILKGAGGRTLLKERLQDRGATVDSLSVYQRNRPEYPSDVLVKELESKPINVILCGSGETVKNLGYYLPEPHRAGHRLIVPSDRVAQQAKALGFQQVYSANGASNPAMLMALEQLNAKHQLKTCQPL